MLSQPSISFDDASIGYSDGYTDGGSTTESDNTHPAMEEVPDQNPEPPLSSTSTVTAPPNPPVPASASEAMAPVVELATTPVSTDTTSSSAGSAGADGSSQLSTVSTTTDESSQSSTASTATVTSTTAARVRMRRRDIPEEERPESKRIFARRLPEGGMFVCGLEECGREYKTRYEMLHHQLARHAIARAAAIAAAPTMTTATAATESTSTASASAPAPAPSTVVATTAGQQQPDVASVSSAHDSTRDIGAAANASPPALVSAAVVTVAVDPAPPAPARASPEQVEPTAAQVAAAVQQCSTSIGVPPRPVSYGSELTLSFYVMPLLLCGIRWYGGEQAGGIGNSLGGWGSIDEWGMRVGDFIWQQHVAYFWQANWEALTGVAASQLVARMRSGRPVGQVYLDSSEQTAMLDRLGLRFPAVYQSIDNTASQLIWERHLSDRAHGEPDWTPQSGRFLVSRHRQSAYQQIEAGALTLAQMADRANSGAGMNPELCGVCRLPIVGANSVPEPTFPFPCRQHPYHHGCVIDMLRMNVRPECPTCRRAIPTEHRPPRTANNRPYVDTTEESDRKFAARANLTLAEQQAEVYDPVDEEIRLRDRDGSWEPATNHRLQDTGHWTDPNAPNGRGPLTARQHVSASRERNRRNAAPSAADAATAARAAAWRWTANGQSRGTGATQPRAATASTASAPTTPAAAATTATAAPAAPAAPVPASNSGRRAAPPNGGRRAAPGGGGDGDGGPPDADPSSDPAVGDDRKQHDRPDKPYATFRQMWRAIKHAKERWINTARDLLRQFRLASEANDEAAMISALEQIMDLPSESLVIKRGFDRRRPNRPNTDLRSQLEAYTTSRTARLQLASETQARVNRTALDLGQLGEQKSSPTASVPVSAAAASPATVASTAVPAASASASASASAPAANTASAASPALADDERETKQKVKRAMLKANDGFYGRAAQALMSGKIVPFDGSEAMTAQFNRLHPPASGPMPPVPANALRPNVMADPKVLQQLVREQLANGSAPGPSGWTGELILVLMDDEECAHSIGYLVSDMLSGRLRHDRFRELLLPARLIPLEKTDERGVRTGVRPIAVIEAFYRLAGLYALQLCDVRAAFDESQTQYGVKRKGGSERAFALIRAALDAGGTDSIALSTDIENAFNTRERSIIANHLYEDERFKPMYRLFDWSYSGATDLYVYERSNRVGIFQSAEGVRQGDPLAAVVFALSMEHIYNAAIAVGNSDLTDPTARCTGVSVLDDFTIVGHHRAVFRAYDEFRRLCALEHIRLNGDKCKVLCPHAPAIPAHVLGECGRRAIAVVSNGMKVLGGMLSFDDRVIRDFTQTVVTKQMRMFDLLEHPLMRSSIACRIGQLCGVPRINYTTQITPPGLGQLAFEGWDKRVRDFVSKKLLEYTGDNLPTPVRQQIAMPMREGGLGFTRAIQSHHTFLLSALQALPDLPDAMYARLLEAVMPRSMYNGRGRPTSFDHMQYAFNHVRAIDPECALLPATFHALLVQYRDTGTTNDLRKAVATMLETRRLNQVQSWGTAAQARVLSAKTKGANMYLTVPANWSGGERLNTAATARRPGGVGFGDNQYYLRDDEFIAATRHRLGIKPINPMPALCECRSALSTLPHDHYHTCARLRKSGPTHRHDMIVAELASIARTVTPNVTVEPRSTDEARRDNKRPDLHIRLARSELWVDVSVTTPSAPSYQFAAARHTLSSARQRERAKATKYAQFMREDGRSENDGKFVPFVMESYGAFGPRCQEVIYLLSREAERCNIVDASEFKRMAFRRLAFVLQRGNAVVSNVGLKRSTPSVSVVRVRAAATAVPMPAAPAGLGAPARR